MYINKSNNFRAFNIITRVMYIPDKSSIKEYLDTEYEDYIKDENKNKIIFMQSTGLKDILGRESFDGDILKMIARYDGYDKNRVIDHKHIHNYLVIQREEEGFLNLEAEYNIERTFMFDEMTWDVEFYNIEVLVNFEIVGNIHENSDMLLRNFETKWSKDYREMRRKNN